MLLTLSTTNHPATDLGFLLHKHPARVHSREESYGTAHLFYAEATPERCTAVLFVEVDPVGLVRRRRGPSGDAGLLDQYVNDRPYAASSLLSVAIADTLGSALHGRSAERPELAATPIPLEVALPVLPCRGGEALLRGLFDPLGYQVEVTAHPLDARFPAWGESACFSVRLTTTAALQAVLTHLYVLIPVLDNDKHYWVGEAELEKLLRHGEPWLAAHPELDLIARRYLKYRRSLADQAIERLTAADDGVVEPADEAGDELTRGDAGEQTLERGLSLNEERMTKVADLIESLGAASVIDLGCGEGRLIKRLLGLKSVTRITGVDVSHRALEIAESRLNLERLPKVRRDKLTLLHGSLMYRDARFAGHDLAAVIEVIEHLDAPRLHAFERVLFEQARPRWAILTTPNREYNDRFPSLPTGRMRHPDHRFEWSRAEFESWANHQARRFGYGVTFRPIGPLDPELGAPTQLALFSLEGEPQEAAA